MDLSNLQYPQPGWLGWRWGVLGSLSALAKEANRSPATVRRHLVRHFRYLPRPAVRTRHGAANPFAGKRHTPDTRRRISRAVRESQARRRQSGKSLG